MGIGCKHDDKFIDMADEGTSHCVYCRAMAAEVEVERLREEAKLSTLAAQDDLADVLIDKVLDEEALRAEVERLRQEGDWGIRAWARRKREEKRRKAAEAAATEELKRITPPNARLKELAAQSPPPPEWFEGEEEQLFSG